MAVARQDILEEVAGYIDFGVEDARMLRSMGPALRRYFHPIVEDFYAAIEQSPGASSVITGGREQTERLKSTLRDWLEGLLGGVYDEAYLERRSRIGRMHVRIGLDQRYMFSAMNILRQGLHRALDEIADADREQWTRTKERLGHDAINKICDIELAIMLETYREDYIAEMRSKQRLATLGQFAASIGHELRNPLAVMETSLHLLGRRVRDDERAQKHVTRMGQQINLCSSIIADLLEMARDRPPDRQRTDVGTLVREAVEGIPHRSGATVEVDIAGDLGEAWVDPMQLRQVVVNLVMNAMQAVTSEGRSGRVTVGARHNGGALHLTVADDGPGLSPEVRRRVFEPLFTTRSKGIGLGLALCRRIVEKHGGSIEADNGERGGAVFRLTIPQAFGGS
ncbi:MAG: protoglobin domain-containing protein [Polyangiales bacterium]